MTTENVHQEGGEGRSDASAAPAARHVGPQGQGGPEGEQGAGVQAPTLDEQIEATLKASLNEQDPVKRSALNGQLRALYEARYPEPPAPTTTVPLSELQQQVVSDIRADVADLALPVPSDQLALAMDFAIGEAALDRSGVREYDSETGMAALRTRHGAATEALVHDARSAVQALGPSVKDYLESTRLGDHPAVVTVLAQWQRGAFKLSPEQARQRMGSEKDPTLRRLLAMLAARS
jgi:hypothetical protein